MCSPDVNCIEKTFVKLKAIKWMYTKLAIEVQTAT